MDNSDTIPMLEMCLVKYDSILKNVPNPEWRIYMFKVSPPTNGDRKYFIMVIHQQKNKRHESYYFRTRKEANTKYNSLLRNEEKLYLQKKFGRTELRLTK